MRAARIELASLAWKAGILAIIRRPQTWSIIPQLLRYVSSRYGKGLARLQLAAEQAFRHQALDSTLHDATERYCGSFELRSQDGTPLRHDQCWMARALHEDRRYDGRELTIVRPEGGRRAALAYASPVHDGNGRVVAATCVLIDVTERAEARYATENTLRISENRLFVVQYRTRPEGLP